MKKIRKGNDIEMTWTFTGDGDITDAIVTLHDRYGRSCPLTYSIDEMVVSATFYGKDQQTTGDYRLLLQKNIDAVGMVTIDKVDAFELVGVCDFTIQSGTDEGTITTATLEFTSSFSTGGTSVDAYTKEETDALLAEKEDALTYYTEETTEETATIDTGSASVVVTNEGVEIATDDGTFTYNGNDVTTAADFKTINGTSIVGSGDIEVAADLTYYTEDTTAETATIDVGNASVSVQNSDGGNVGVNATHIQLTDGTKSITIADNSISVTDSASTIAVGSGISVSVEEGTTFNYKESEVAVVDDFDDYYTSDEVNELVGGKLNRMALVSVEEGTTSLTAAENTYYNFAGSVGTLEITLPQPSAQYPQSIVFHLTTGTSPSVTFAPSGLIEEFDGFAISASKTYEVNALWNGSIWTLAQGIIS